jgi:urea transport system permease protein
LPELWLFALGLLFIGVTLFMQQGMLGVLSKLKRKKAVAAAEEAA